jgi:essential nuclear protein 1
MGKESTKATKGARAPRHDPLHVQLADMPENNTMKKAPRQKFVDRNNRAEETGEVPYRVFNVESSMF